TPAGPRLHGVLSGCTFVHGDTLKRTTLSERSENANEVKLSGSDFCAIGTSFTFAELPKPRVDPRDAATVLRQFALGVDRLIEARTSVSDVQHAVRELARVASLFAEIDRTRYAEIDKIAQGLASSYPVFESAREAVSALAIGVRSVPVGPPDPT
ncbi:MAG: hypothetical protein ABI664_23980, partial [bacterium]